MTKIGLISDTHGFLHERVTDYFSECNEIWHAGDIGSLEVANKLSSFKPFKAVYGNIDGQEIRGYYPEILRFTCEQVEVFIKHIGGYPGRYDRSVYQELKENPPDLFICGHSHILKVMYDKNLGFLHINPGAAGKSGIHQQKTLVRFIIHEKEIKDLEVIELGKR